MSKYYKCLRGKCDFSLGDADKGRNLRKVLHRV